jgi:hypothetical protein
MAAPDPMDEALAPHARRADRLIVDRFADARSHARTGHVALAAQRLSDLHHGLIGPDGSGIIGDARAAAYRDAWRLEPHDPELHDPDRRYPTSEGAQAARTAPIGGGDAYRELALLLERARVALVTAHAAAGRSGDAARRATAIDTWHEQHGTAIRRWARGRLSDDQIGIHAATNWLRMRGEFRDDGADRESGVAPVAPA